MKNILHLTKYQRMFKVIEIMQTWHFDSSLIFHQLGQITLLKSAHQQLAKTDVLDHLLHILTDIEFSYDKYLKPKHSVQDVFFSKGRIKHFATDKISAQVSFFPKVKNETFS
jgi:hypothetical protein